MTKSSVSGDSVVDCHHANPLTQWCNVTDWFLDSLTYMGQRSNEIREALETREEESVPLRSEVIRKLRASNSSRLDDIFDIFCDIEKAVSSAANAYGRGVIQQGKYGVSAESLRQQALAYVERFRWYASYVPSDGLPLTDDQRVIWDLLKGRSLTACQILRELDPNSGISEEAIRKRISAIRKSGRRIENDRGARGYYRPDALPR